MNYETQSEFSIGFVRSFAKIFLSKIKVKYIDRLSPHKIILQGEIRKNGDPIYIMHNDGELYYLQFPDTLSPEGEIPEPITIEEFIHKILHEI